MYRVRGNSGSRVKSKQKSANVPGFLRFQKVASPVSRFKEAIDESTTWFCSFGLCSLGSLLFALALSVSDPGASFEGRAVVTGRVSKQGRVPPPDRWFPLKPSKSPGSFEGSPLSLVASWIHFNALQHLGPLACANCSVSRFSFKPFHNGASCCETGPRVCKRPYLGLVGIMSPQ